MNMPANAVRSLWVLRARLPPGGPACLQATVTSVTPSVGDATQNLHETVSDSSSDDDDSLPNIFAIWNEAYRNGLQILGERLTFR